MSAGKQHLSAAFAGGSGGEMQEMDMESEPFSPHVGPVTLSVLLGGRRASFIGLEMHYDVTVETPPSECKLQVTFYCLALQPMPRLSGICGGCRT